MGTTIRLIAPDITVTITGDRPDLGPTYDKLEGWYDLPAVDMGFSKRPNGPGAFAPEQTHPDEAVVSIEGKSFNATRTAALLQREDFLMLYNDGRPITCEVEDDLRTTRREVLVADVGLPWTIHPEFDYSIDMRAADSRRYGDAVTVGTPLPAAGEGLATPLTYPLAFGTAAVSGRITIENGGNTETVTVFTVSGGSMPDGFELVNVGTGERLTYVGPVTEGTTVVLDSRLQAAFINGDFPASRYLSAPQWWSVPRRGSVTVQFVARGTVTGTPRVDASTAPAYY